MEGLGPASRCAGQACDRRQLEAVGSVLCVTERQEADVRFEVRNWLDGIRYLLDRPEQCGDRLLGSNPVLYQVREDVVWSCANTKRHSFQRLELATHDGPSLVNALKLAGFELLNDPSLALKLLHSFGA